MNIYTALFVVISLSTCQEVTAQNKQQYILYVNSHKAQCQGEAMMSCLLVRKDTLPGTAWEFMDPHIEGFEYKPGNLYTIRVEEETLPRDKVMADASSKRFRLIKVVDVRPDLSLRINDIWVLTHIEGQEFHGNAGNEPPYLELHVADGRFMGKDGCNRFQGIIEDLGISTLILGPAAGTKMHCPDDQISPQFRSLLAQVNGYKIEHMQLRLQNKEGSELLRFKKVD